MEVIDVAYVLLHFPHFTETFVAEEIRQVQRQGIRVHLFSLLKPKKGPVHSVSEELAQQVCYAPEIYQLELWIAQLIYLYKAPLMFLQLFWVLLRHPSPGILFHLKRIIIFLKAIWITSQLDGANIQLVHTHFAWLSAAASMIVSEFLDIPFTATTHAYDIYSKKNDLLDLTVKYADCIVTISEYNKHAMLKLIGSMDMEKIEVIHCGIDLDRFNPNGKEFEDEIFEITSVGSLVEKKGHEYLIRACNELKAQGLIFHCVIVGGGPLIQPLSEQIRELQLEESVKLVGRQMQHWVYERMNTSDAFVLACVTSKEGDQDGIPVAIMEALAMGVPVISTSVSGIPELIHHESTGLIINERDVHALTIALSRLAKDVALRKRLAKQGRITVEDEFDILKTAEKLAALFRRVIEERVK
jgi:glycosyltransferase involved in cell wall biosynthesis